MKTRIPMIAGLLLLGGALLASLPASAQRRPDPPEDPETRYRACMALAQKRPADGWEEALAWAGLGGGEPAAHCGAAALIGLRQYGEAATRLERLAEKSHSDPAIRAGMLSQASQAWLLEEKPDLAYAAATTALKLSPNDPDILADRAEALAAARNYAQAEEDLSRALKIAPKRADLLAFRASARRYMDNFSGARADIDQALKIDPKNVDAWAESGNLRRIAGDDAGARKDWVRVLEIAPGSDAADQARNNIERLDIPER